VTLVCWDAAALHWSLCEFLKERGEDEALASLWEFSREARLVDLKFLDLHIRRLEDPQTSAAAAFQDFARRVTGVELPDDEELRRQVLQIPKGTPPTVPGAVHQLAGQVVRMMLAAHASYMASARSALLPVVRELRSLGRLTSRRLRNLS